MGSSYDEFPHSVNEKLIRLGRKVRSWEFNEV